MATPDEKSSNHESNDTRTHGNSGYTLDQSRRAALAEVDNAKFSWFHAKVCIVAGVGFFTDASVYSPGATVRRSILITFLFQLRYLRDQRRFYYVGLCVRRRW